MKKFYFLTLALVASIEISAQNPLSTVISSTYLGGTSATGYPAVIAEDKSGNIFFTGQVNGAYNNSCTCYQASFPTTVGSVNPNYGNSIPFIYANTSIVSKLSNDLSTLVSSTWIGGYSALTVTGLTIDKTGNVYLVGDGDVCNLPCRTSFVMKLNNNLSAQLAVTTFGSTINSQGYYSTTTGIALDSSGNVFVTGYTNDTAILTFPSSYQKVNNWLGNGGGNAFIVEFNGNLSTQLAGTYFGGNNYGTSASISLDNSGNVFITGNTKASLPVTVNAYQGSFSGTSTSFIAKFDKNLTTLGSCTYFGDSTTAVQLRSDASGNIILVGNTTSNAFPITPGAYHTTPNVNGGLFVSKLNNSLSNLLASSYIGGNHGVSINGITLDGVNNAYITGTTTSTNYPTTPGAYQSSPLGSNGAVFISILNSPFTNLIGSTYIGGNGDQGASIIADDSNHIYLGGISYSLAYPTTPTAYQQTNNASPSSNFIISKLNSQVLGLKEIRKEIELKVYPNPSNGIFTIQVTNGRQLLANSLVEIYNMLGEKLFSPPLTPLQMGNSLQIQIDLSGKPAGVYLYRVLTETGYLVSEGKFIIN